MPLPSFPLEFHILSSAFSSLPPSPPNAIPPPSPSPSLSLSLSRCLALYCRIVATRHHYAGLYKLFAERLRSKNNIFLAEVTLFMSPNNSRKSHTHGPNHAGLYTLFAERSRSKNEAEVTHPMSPNNSQKSHAHGPSRVVHTFC